MGFFNFLSSSYSYGDFAISIEYFFLPNTEHLLLSESSFNSPLSLAIIDLCLDLKVPLSFLFDSPKLILGSFLFLAVYY